MVKAKTGRDCIQNPSDTDATYVAHKGRGRCQPLSGTKETWVAPFGLPLGRPGPGRPPGKNLRTGIVRLLLSLSFNFL